MPASGIISINIKPKVFNTFGYPLYLPPYSVFVNKSSGLQYYYNSNTVLKIDNSTVLVPLVEGEIETLNHIATGLHIERIYLDSDAIADKSISLSVGDKIFTEVKSFYDNEGLFDDRQFVVKFSNRLDNPIVVYVKGAKLNDNIAIVYRMTSGENGNINYKAIFETENIINSQGNQIELTDEDSTIVSVSGFSLGSNGTDENALRAAIGFNHGSNILFDSVSYSEFINKFSTVLLQSVVPNRTINNIYLSKKQYINTEAIIKIEESYKNIIDFKTYLLPKEDLDQLSNLISNNEYALSSHNLIDSKINKYAIQILFKTQIDNKKYSFELKNLLYLEFSKFLYNKNHSINMELLFTDFMNKYNISFEYSVFNNIIENNKLKDKVNQLTPYIIKSTDEYLPILRGDFDICDFEFKPVKLFFDINNISKSELN